MRRQNKEKWETKRASATQTGINQGLMITPTPEVDMEDTPSAYSNTPLVDQQHNLHISGPSSASSTSAKRQQDDDESATQTTKESIVSSQATHVSEPPPFDADQSIISEVEQLVKSTNEGILNHSKGLRDELTNFANQNISIAGDILESSARIAIGMELLQRIPLEHNGAVETARVAKLSRFFSGEVWVAMSLRQVLSLNEILIKRFVTSTMIEVAGVSRDRVVSFTNVHQKAEIVVSKAAFWTVVAVWGLKHGYAIAAGALNIFSGGDRNWGKEQELFFGRDRRWVNDEEIVVVVKMAMESQSSELEDLAMLVILAARSADAADDWGEKNKDAGGQRWKDWLREKKRDPDVGCFVSDVNPLMSN